MCSVVIKLINFLVVSCNEQNEKITEDVEEKGEEKYFESHYYVLTNNNSGHQIMQSSKRNKSNSSRSFVQAFLIL